MFPVEMKDQVQPASAPRPNILFIICDGLNDAVGGMDGRPQARTWSTTLRW